MIVCSRLTLLYMLSFIEQFTTVSVPIVLGSRAPEISVSFMPDA